MTVGWIALAVAVAAQPPDKTQLPKGQMPDLGRATKVGDELPLFDFDAYFSGTWTFEWDMPDGALGESGTVTGTNDGYTQAGNGHRCLRGNQLLRRARFEWLLDHVDLR